MKKLLLAAVLFLGAVTPLQAEPSGTFSVLFEDIIVVADSKNVRIDTVFSAWQDLGVGRFLHYGVQAISGIIDTAWGDDSLFFDLQLSFDGSLATMTSILELDTLNGVGGTVGATVIDADATMLPRWGRLRIIHRDSIGVGEADAALVDTSPTYEKTLKLWFTWR